MSGVEGIDEAEMYRRLHLYVCKRHGNGPSAVLAPRVKSAAGFEAKRTIDAISMGLYESKGMLIEGYEIKVSRSDWLRELKNPAKSAEFMRLVDRFWLVVANDSIVKDGELPDGWGLLVSQDDGHLTLRTRAKRLHADDDLPPAFSRAFLAPLLRAMRFAPRDSSCPDLETAPSPNPVPSP